MRSNAQNTNFSKQKQSTEHKDKSTKKPCNESFKGMNLV